jgi:V8-like Glu-specific endopeptidase
MCEPSRAGLCELFSRSAKLSTALTLLYAGTLVPTALAQQDGFVAAENAEIRNSAARDPGGYWTPDELLRARPIELPMAQGSAREMMERSAREMLERAARPTDGQPPEAGVRPESAAAARASLAVDGEAVPQAEQVRPDLKDRLFAGSRLQDGNSAPEAAAPAANEGSGAVAPLAVGTFNSGAYFSSSQLVPTDARLHYPYRAVGKLFFEEPGEGSFICSGAVIRPRLILTAGHCVHKGSGGAGGNFTRFLFVPAYHDGQAPLQAWNWTWVITTNSWATGNGNVPNPGDWAIIEVEDRRFEGGMKRIGDVTGTFGYRTNALLPNHTKKIGYPAGFDNGEVMHQVDSQGSADGGQNTVLYGSDMTGGSSGGPWIENFGVRSVGQTGGIDALPNRIVGVTSYGFVSPDPKVQGSSVFNDEFVRMLNAACAHKAGNC